jgi:hypothetical protein
MAAWMAWAKAWRSWAVAVLTSLDMRVHPFVKTGIGWDKE